MKSFARPVFEVVRFRDSVITNSNYCFCYDNVIDFGEGQNDCGADTAFCTCIINHVAGTLNCTPCATNEE